LEFEGACGSFCRVFLGSGAPGIRGFLGYEELAGNTQREEEKLPFGLFAVKLLEPSVEIPRN
jgi:hypothetical protein